MKKIFGIIVIALLIIIAKPSAAQDSIITSVNFSAASNAYSAITTYTYSFTAGTAMPAGTIIYLLFYDAAGAKTTAENGPNMLYGEYASTSTLNIFSYGHYADSTVGLIYLNEDHPAGQYSFTVSAVVNPGIKVTLTPALSTTTEAVNSNGYATMAAESLIIGQVPSKPNKDKMQVLNIKQRSALLKWQQQEEATYYRVRLDVYINQSYEKIKTYYSVTENRKQLGKKILNKNTKYRYKLRACNQNGCSAWSAYKKFHTK